MKTPENASSNHDAHPLSLRFLRSRPGKSRCSPFGTEVGPSKRTEVKSGLLASATSRPLKAGISARQLERRTAHLHRPARARRASESVGATRESDSRAFFASETVRNPCEMDVPAHFQAVYQPENPASDLLRPARSDSNTTATGPRSRDPRPSSQPTCSPRHPTSLT